MRAEEHKSACKYAQPQWVTKLSFRRPWGSHKLFKRKFRRISSRDLQKWVLKSNHPRFRGVFDSCRCPECHPSLRLLSCFLPDSESLRPSTDNSAMKRGCKRNGWAREGSRWRHKGNRGPSRGTEGPNKLSKTPSIAMVLLMVLVAGARADLLRNGQDIGPGLA